MKKNKCNWSAIILNDVITCLENCYIFNAIRKKNQPHFFSKRREAKGRITSVSLVKRAIFCWAYHLWFLTQFFSSTFSRSTLLFSLSLIRFVFISRYNSITWNIYLRDMKQLFFLSLFVFMRDGFFFCVLWWLLLLNSVNVSDEMLSPNERI